MLKFYQTSGWRKAIQSWWLALVLAGVCLFLVSVVYNRYTIERDMAARRLEAEAELRELEARRTEMQEKVEYLSSERGIEAEMRRNFDVAQPGEQVVIILDPETEESTIEPLAVPQSDTPPWYIFWR